MRRLFPVIVVTVVLAISGCTVVDGDDSTESIEGTATIDDSPEPDDFEVRYDSIIRVADSTDESTDDKDPPDSDTGEPSVNEHGRTDEGVALDEGILEIHAINVDQADATLVISPSGETMLIDSGDWRDDGETVLNYLESVGVERIDHLISTHGHADHIGGHAAVIEQFETEKEGIGQIWDSGVSHTTQTYDRYLDAVEEHNVTLFETQEGDEIPIDGINVTVVNPPANSAKPSDFHYNSVAVVVEYEKTVFLATGDAEIDAENRMMNEHGRALEAEIYHAGHHGSNTSSTDPFLEAVDPEVAVISSAYDSQFGHPHEAVLKRFADRGVATVWTGIHGSMVFESDGETYTAKAQTNATTRPTEIRNEPEVTVDPTVEPEYELASGEGGKIEDYIQEDTGKVETEGLFDAISDWRKDIIDTDLVLELIDYWRSGEEVV